MSSESEVKKSANALAHCLDADVFIYNGPMERGNDRKVIAAVGSRKKRRPNVLLLLVTEGGDPDVAYRISRCLQFSYPQGKFLCFISGFCKSAGTLLALGAYELIFSDHGEIGPIDVQMGKKDEIWEWQSGLTVNASLSALNEQAFQAFESFLLQTKSHLRGGITLRTACDVAAKLTTGLYSPMFQQFDPMHIGEAGRSVLIAEKYALRLDMRFRNIKSEQLENLISGYPSHGFVIDRDEAAFMLHRVRRAGEFETALESALGDAACVPMETAILEYFSDEVEVQDLATQEMQDGKGTLHDAPAEHGLGATPSSPIGDVPGDGQASANA